MSTGNNIETVQAFLAAQYEQDFDRAFKDYAHYDFNWIVGSDANEALRHAIPWAGYTHHGKEGYIKLTTMLFSEFEALEFDAINYTDAQQHVFVEGHFMFRHRETGKLADSDWVARFDIEHGRIAGGQFFENTAAVAAARIAN